MNIGLVAMQAAPKVCNALRNIGMWPMTKQDMIDVLKNHPRAKDAIFWFCQAWHSGEDDLYQIMCSLDFEPRPWSMTAHVKDPKTGFLVNNPLYDPVLIDLLQQLEVLAPVVEPPLNPVKLADVKEGQVLTAGSSFHCLQNRWPCRVYRHHGALGVACSGAVHGVKLLPGSETTFHPLTEDKDGFVIGFRR